MTPLTDASKEKFGLMETPSSFPRKERAPTRLLSSTSEFLGLMIYISGLAQMIHIWKIVNLKLERNLVGVRAITLFLLRYI